MAADFGIRSDRVPFVLVAPFINAVCELLKKRGGGGGGLSVFPHGCARRRLSERLSFLLFFCFRSMPC